MRTLLTGFGPFAEVVRNPSARVAEHFELRGAPGHDLTVRILPVSFAGASVELYSLLVEGRFDLAILMGVAGSESEIRIETRGRNLDSARIPDCDGAQPHGVIEAPGPEAYETQLDSARLLEALRAAGVPARLSDSAGGYVCNRAYFAALHAVHRHSLPTRCLFLHLPSDADTFQNSSEPVGMDFEIQITAVARILEVLASADW